MPSTAMTIEGFLARCEAGSSTVAFYRDELARFERKIGAPLAIASTSALERLKEDLRKAKSGATRCRLLRQFYRAAGQPDRSDIFKLKRKDARLPEKDILTLPEVNAMLGAARSLRDRAFLTVLWESGARVTEVLSLDIGDVQEFVSHENGGRAFLTVFFRKVKIAGEEHSSLLVEGSEHLRAWLNAYAPDREDMPLFPSGRGGGVRMTKDGAEKLVAKTAVRAGLKKPVYPHLFRHSRTTHLLRIGVPDIQVAKLLGWKSTRMLQRYAHLVKRDAYAALLKAYGYEPPEPLTHEKLLAAEGDLRPVLPMVRAPMAVPNREEIEKLLTNPEVLRFLKMVQEAAK